ncbi:MAG: NAD(P)/FAD-dependent oxidoreductase [Lachnospiraceae bacterium]|jgi:uncharacterized FAD-dependent dehydrogenase
MIRVTQIKLKLPYREKDIRNAIIKDLRLPSDAGISYRLLKRSIDSRHRPDLSAVLTVGVIGVKIRGHLVSEEKILFRSGVKNAAPFSEESYRFPEKCTRRLREEERPVIVGFGPAGIFAALELAKAGFRPLVLERGSSMDERTADVEAFWDGGELKKDSNVQFGEGGAGTFSDGKLATGIGDKNGRIREVMNTFVRNGAPEEITWDQHPHVGTDVLSRVIPSIREEILSFGGEVRFHCRFDGIETDGGELRAVRFTDESGKQQVRAAKSLILAIGHSSRDTFPVLAHEGIPMCAKPFAVGVRCEHPQSLINEYAYGRRFAAPDMMRESGLETASYKLTANLPSGRGVYSFCMCPGGYVVNSSSEPGRLCVNGMSYSGRSGANANSALVVTVTPDDFGNNCFDGLKFQEKLEEAAYAAAGGRIPVQLLADFKAGRVSKALGDVAPQTKGAWELGNVREILPAFVSESLCEAFPAFAKRIPGFDRPDALLLGVEARTSSPVRILRDETMQSAVRGLFPCGEGAGYAGGITSAAVDGIRTAEAVARRIAWP